MNKNAESTIVSELLKFLESGQLYLGFKPVMWSVVEKTALAEAEIEYIEKKLRIAQRKLTKQRAIITAEAFEKRARELKDKAKDAQKRAQATNQLLKKSFDQSMDEIRKHLLKIIAEVAEETGAGVVLFRSAIVIAVKKLEISQEVLKRLNKKLPSVKVVFAKNK